MTRSKARSWARWSLALAAPLAAITWFSWTAVEAAGPADPQLYKVPGVADVKQRSAIAATGAHIFEAGADYVMLEATPAELGAVRALGFAPQAPDAGEVRIAAFPSEDPGYHDYQEASDELTIAAARYPAIFQLRELGTSPEGRTIWLGKLSDHVGRDENEPEVLFTHHQHAREHLTVEQGLYTLRILTEGYGHDPRITQIVDSREIWFVFDANPDGGEFDIETDNYVSWRKNRQANESSDRIGTDLNRNWDFRFGCCGGSSGAVASSTYRGARGFSASETEMISEFVNSRVIGGEQQIKAHIDFHSFSELVLWPYGYTEDDVPSDMTQEDHDAFVAIGTKIAEMNGYTPEQSSDLYITDGTINDWLYGVHKIFSFTLELYPKTTKDGGFYPPDEVIARETERNREPILYFLEQADCPYRSIGKEAQFCQASGQ